MATAATSLLGLALPVTGELSGTWGDTVNVSITALLDSAVAGTTTLSSDADVTLTTTTLAANQARQAVILWTAGGTVTRTITAPAQSKAYIVINKTSSSQSIKIVGAGPTTGVTIVAGTAAFVVWNGVDFVTASVTSTTGVLPVANGGTGLSSGTSGGVLAYTATGTLASSTALAANALVIGGGAGAAPSTTTTGTGVVTALGVNTGTAGAFVVNGGALGTPSSGTVTNLTGTASININGTVGATTATTGAFTSLTASTTLGVTGVSTLTAGAVIQGLTVGRGSGAVATNTAVGASALVANTTGSRNTANGWAPLFSNTTGTSNTAFGYGTLFANIVGNGNTAIGDAALTVNTASNNTAVGYFALAANTTATNNTAVGYQAGYTSQASSYNTFLGYQAGYTSNAGGTGLNTCVGYVSGYSLTTGTSNLIIGTNPSTGAGYSMTTGSKNTLVGGFSGNQDSLDIRTASNYVVLSDGDGARQITMKEGQTLALDSAVPNAGTGITFPATQSASSNANTLDDYEEGTWTPGQGNLTLSAGTFVSSGTYTKIGRTVYFTYIVTTNDPATQTVSISASGATALNLPFAEAFSGTSTAYDYSSVGVVTQVASSRVYFYSTVSSRAQITGGGVYSV